MNTRRNLLSGRGMLALGAAMALAAASPALAQRGPNFGRGAPQENTGNSAGAPSSDGDASGANAVNVRPREANISEKPPVVIGYLVAVLVLLTVVGVTIMPSKRTHQD